MVSKDKYYQLKSQGLCVKCGDPREDSPSEVRCAPCHEKFLSTKKEKEAERASSGSCVQCGAAGLVGFSKYCNSCREKNASYKKKINTTPLSVFKESNENCRLCNGLIDTVGIVCQKCLDLVQFTRQDALMRYGNQCYRCMSDNLDELVIASADITAPMKHSGPELYKYICFSVAAPKIYTAICSSCYWQSNIEYIRNIRDTLLAKPTTTEDAAGLVEEILGNAEEISDLDEEPIDIDDSEDLDEDD